MSNSDQRTKSTSSTNCKQLRLRTVDIAEMGASSIQDLRCLFQAIYEASDKLSQPHELAKIGVYLCDDWAGTLDCERKNLEPLSSN